MQRFDSGVRRAKTALSVSPFDKSKKGRIAVKVINQLGDEDDECVSRRNGIPIYAAVDHTHDYVVQTSVQSASRTRTTLPEMSGLRWATSRPGMWGAALAVTLMISP